MRLEWLLRHDELRQVQCDKGEMIPIITGALQTFNNNTNDDLKKLKIQNQKDALQKVISTRSVNILNNHFRRNDFG